MITSLSSLESHLNLIRLTISKRENIGVNAVCRSNILKMALLTIVSFGILSVSTLTNGAEITYDNRRPNNQND